MSETAIIEQPQTEQPPASPAPETPEAPPSLSIRQHAEQFGHDKAPRARDDAGRFTKGDPKSTETPPAPDQKTVAAPSRPDEAPKKLHAKKDIATPEDVPRIRELTAKWRNEQRQREALEAELAQYRGQGAPQLPQPALPPVQQAITQPNLARPALTDAEFYQQYPDATVGDYINYQVSYRLAQAGAQQRQQATQSELDAFAQKTESDHRSRIEAYAAKVPDWDTVMAGAEDVPTTPVVDWAVKLHPRGPEIVLHLARHPEDAFQLALQTRQAPLDEASVAWTQRLFDRWLQAAPTASAAPARHPVAPPPPNAVRTGPIKTGDEPPTDGRIRSHAQYFGYDKRR